MMQYLTLIGIIVIIGFLHSCYKTGDVESCWTCRAYNSSEVVIASEKICTAGQEEVFLNEYNDLYTLCTQ